MAKFIFRGNIAVVEHLPYHPMVMGLILATASSTGIEKIRKVIFKGY
jgi:hypothetical protein